MRAHQSSLNFCVGLNFRKGFFKFLKKSIPSLILCFWLIFKSDFFIYLRHKTPAHSSEEPKAGPQRVAVL